MNRITRIALIVFPILLFALFALATWGMGLAGFLDSDRVVISGAVSPDASRSAQVERMVVGGVPSIVVMVRSRWLPNWYLTGCAAASHYEEVEAEVRWTSNNAITVRHSGDQRFWKVGAAPFHNGSCESVTVKFDRLAGKPPFR